MKLNAAYTCFCLFAFLSACSGLRDTAEPPAELLPFDPEVKIKKIWSVDTGRGSGDFLLSLTPFIDGNTIYTSDTKGRLLALDKDSGKIVWKRTLKRMVSAALGGDRTALYVGTADGQLVSVDKESGEANWSTHLSSEILARPVTALGVIVVQTTDGAISGIASSSGVILWTRRRTVPPLSLRGTGKPVIFNELVLTGMDTGQLLALSLFEGQIIWETPLSAVRGRNEIERIADADIQPLVDEGLVFGASYQGGLAALSLENGRVLWSTDLSTYHGVSMDRFGALYLSDASSHIWSIYKRNGTTLWKQNKLRGRRLVKPIARGDYLVSADFEGYVHVLSTSDGRIVGRFRLSGEGYIESPMERDGVFYVLDKTGQLSAFTLHRDMRS